MVLIHAAAGGVGTLLVQLAKNAGKKVLYVCMHASMHTLNTPSFSPVPPPPKPTGLMCHATAGLSVIGLMGLGTSGVCLIGPMAHVTSGAFLIGLIAHVTSGAFTIGLMAHVTSGAFLIDRMAHVTSGVS